MLPKQVAPEFGGQYFCLEKYYVQEGGLHRKFRELLLKLSCYFDVKVSENDGGDVEAAVGEARITLDRDDAYMTLYDPDADLLEMVKVLAGTDGLFVWRSRQDC